MPRVLNLTYSFVEGVKASYPFYTIRLLGGTLYFLGMLLMAYNVFKTIVGQRAVNPVIPDYSSKPAASAQA